MVPTKAPTFFRWPAPIYWEMMTCPALEKPMATKVRKLETSPPMDTADRPTDSMTSPTMTMSAML